MTTLYNIQRERADRITEMRRKRAVKACSEAGLDPSLLGIHPHNAMCSYNAGKPWQNVDYSKVRLCLRILSNMYEAHKVLDQWSNRMTREHGCMYIHTKLPE